MDQQLFDFMRDRFASLEDGQKQLAKDVEDGNTGIHRRLDIFDSRLTKVEENQKPPSKVGFWSGIGTAIGAGVYTVYSWFSAK